MIRNGIAYLYMTNNTVAKGWQLSTKKISAKNSIPGNTLAPLYNDVRINHHIKMYLFIQMCLADKFCLMPIILYIAPIPI